MSIYLATYLHVLYMVVSLFWDPLCTLLFYISYHHHNFRHVGHDQFASWDLEVPQDLGLVVVNHLWSCLPS